MGAHLIIRKVADKSGDEPDFEKGESWPLDHVKILSEEIPKEHEFSEKFVNDAMMEGWMSVNKGNLVIHTIDGDVTFSIERRPGRFDEVTDPGHKFHKKDQTEVFHTFKVVLIDG